MGNLEPPIINKNNTEDLKIAWLAGFIDGEGYIGITFQRKKENQQQSASARYHPYLIITNNNCEVLREIQGSIGSGHVYKLSRNIKTHKQGFQYKLTEMQKLDLLLRRIQPHLRLKQQQCTLLVNFINLRKKAKNHTGRGHRGATSYTREEKIYQKLLTINKRGSVYA